MGVSMAIVSRGEWAQVFRQVRAGDFEAAISRFLVDLSAVTGQLPFFGTTSYIGYPNRRAHELLQALASTQNPETLDGLYRELMKIFEADHPVTFLHPIPSTHVVHRRVAGLSSPYRADPVWYMEHLWLDEERP